MQEFMDFWEHIASWQRIAFLLGGMILFWLLEGYYPLFTFSWKRYRHAGTNLFFLSTTVILNLIFGVVTLWVCSYVTKHEFGLMYLLQIPLWAKVVLWLMLMDFFSQYLPHYMMHKVKFMWKFHMIHHSDTKVDVTTGTRHHPGEWLFREATTIIGAFLLGLPVGMYFLYRSVAAIFTHFNHANIRVPLWLDRPISLLLVSPNMHKVHHHYMRPYTDKNFSNIFSFWDRLFGTFAYEDPRNLRYGLDVLDDKDDENVRYQLKIPFNKKIKTDY
ncbi:MAG: sterol desaturase family protein [Chitinophagaceae bacterium]|nr:MAG: sterol desaturase family protein [Chitinophagaceae bacterium]